MFDWKPLAPPFNTEVTGTHFWPFCEFGGSLKPEALSYEELRNAMACRSQVRGVLEFRYVAADCNITRSRHIHLPETLFQIVQARIARSEPEGVSIVMEDYVVEVWVVERNGSPLPFAFFRPTSGIKFLLGSIDFY